MEEIPVVISNLNSSIFGILRFQELELTDKLVILLPAETGTRIGPQRLFVEIAQRLSKINIASLCIDLPGNGDSYDNSLDTKLISQEGLEQYFNCLNRIIQYLNIHYSFKEFILLSISVGCTPAFYYSRFNNFKRIILLSPVEKNGKLSAINTCNIRGYYQKLFQKQTWAKIFSFKLKFRNIARNVFYYKSKKNKVSTLNFLPSTNLSGDFSLLNIFGEKDATIEDCLIYWQDYLKREKISNYSERIVKGADHSFFGWSFKVEVCDTIIDWLDK